MTKFILGAALLIVPVFIAEANSICPTPMRTQDVLLCAAGNSLGVQRAHLNEKKIKAIFTNPAPLSNPELDIDTVDGETEVSLTHSIDLGRTRRAQQNITHTRLREAQLLSNNEEVDVKIETFVKLHRLRQIQIEAQVAAGISTALNRSISYLRSRPALSPEQQVSLSLFQMALADSKIKNSEAVEEEILIEKFFQQTSDLTLDVLKKLLPELPTTFPDVRLPSLNEGKTNAFLRAEILKELSINELTLESANAWPELKLGPMVKFDKSNGANDKAIGLKLSFELPLFSKNRDGISAANSAVAESQALMSLALKEESTERAQLVRTYQNAFKTLTDIPSLPEVSKIVVKNESLEKRGLISSALLVESYRQQLEITKGRHGREMAVLETLLKIYKIDGKNIEGLL